MKRISIGQGALILIVGILGVILLSAGLWRSQHDGWGDRPSPVSGDRQGDKEEPRTKSGLENANRQDAESTPQNTPRSSASSKHRIPRAIEPILGEHGEIHQERRQTLEALGRNLTEEEIAALERLLRSPSTGLPEGRSIMAEAAIRNAVINRLKESSQSAPRLIETLLAVYNDRQGQHAVMRDYAVQHMASWFEELTAARDPAASEVDRRKARLLETLWGAVDEIDTSIAGTALLSLDRIRRATPDFPLSRLEEAALRVAEDDGASAMAHLSALRICSRLKVRDVLPIAARLGQSGETPVIRRAALATLNDLGGPEHQRLLQRLRRQGDQDL